MSSLPREAREGLQRAWLDILRERHPGVTWIAVEQADDRGSDEETAIAPARAEASLTR